MKLKDILNESRYPKVGDNFTWEYLHTTNHPLGGYNTTREVKITDIDGDRIEYQHSKSDKEPGKNDWNRWSNLKKFTKFKIK